MYYTYLLKTQILVYHMVVVMDAMCRGKKIDKENSLRQGNSR